MNKKRNKIYCQAKLKPGHYPLKVKKIKNRLKHLNKWKDIRKAQKSAITPPTITWYVGCANCALSLELWHKEQTLGLGAQMHLLRIALITDSWGQLPLWAQTNSAPTYLYTVASTILCKREGAFIPTHEQTAIFLMEAETNHLSFIVAVAPYLRLFYTMSVHRDCNPNPLRYRIK